ncbi:MAG: hypothetical protein M0P97_03160 [Candidatus Moranbacteria bacterium]|jgi:hypothetical protein|nr:hypothetical protein [Candidatus Moranbacteria bacterium]
MTNIQIRIARAIDTTRRVVPGYFEKTLAQRLPKTGAGSVVVGFESAEELERALMAAKWESYSHPAVMAGTEAFITKDIRGLLGVIDLVDMPADSIVSLDDRKNTSKVSCVVEGVRGQDVDFTVIILGTEQDEEIVFTFHPGAPVRPSQVQAEPGMHGRQVTVKEALGMGLQTAKIA